VRCLRARGWLDGTERVVVLNTGTGVKYPETIDVDGVRVLDPGDTLPLS